MSTATEPSTTTAVLHGASLWSGIPWDRLDPSRQDDLRRMADAVSQLRWEPPFSPWTVDDDGFIREDGVAVGCIYPGLVDSSRLADLRAALGSPS